MMTVVFLLLVFLLFISNLSWMYIHKYKNKEITLLRETQYRKNIYYMFMVEWLNKKNQGKYVADYLKRNQVKKVAIYGMDYIGKCLYDELMMSDIDVCYVIDQKGKYIEYDIAIPVKKSDENLEKVDAVIVTVLPGYIEIEKKLKSLEIGTILPLDEIINQL